MADPRVESYARLLVERCLNVQPGWQVLVLSTAIARPLVEEVSRQIARRGAYALTRIGFTGVGDLGWLAEAPDELVAELPAIDRYTFEHADAFVQIDAPENTREASRIPPERLTVFRRAVQPVLQRLAGGEVAWVGCQFPCPALAQDAGMSVGEFEDFLYGACLLDWDAEHERMRRYADRFDAADEVRIEGDGTDLSIGLAERTAKIDAGGANIPGGEFFFSPVEDSAEGVISFTEYPALFAGREVTGIRLRFEGGRVVDASAESGEEVLHEVLDTDEGARRLGELGIGCNPGITRHMKNTLFDEKIDGTIHVAVGQGFPELGGTNESAVHWDLVKDLRDGGRILLDGEVVQASGAWSI
jgi:aminopeptidase